jgi:hypothetical protein
MEIEHITELKRDADVDRVDGLKFAIPAEFTCHVHARQQYFRPDRLDEQYHVWTSTFPPIIPKDLQIKLICLVILPPISPSLRPFPQCSTRSRERVAIL